MLGTWPPLTATSTSFFFCQPGAFAAHLSLPNLPATASLQIPKPQNLSLFPSHFTHNTSPVHRPESSRRSFLFRILPWWSKDPVTCEALVTTGFVKERGELKMATMKSLLLLLVLMSAALVPGVVTEATHHENNDVATLKSKLSHFEQGLKAKEARITELDEELSTIRSREDTKLAKLKEDSALTKIRELESQVQSLLEESNKLRVEADLHANRAKTVEETATVHLTDKEKAFKALEEQKQRLQRAERGLQVAEAAMLKAKAETEEQARRLEDLHKAWLPPWAATHADTIQKTASSRWSTHADPVVKNLQRSASNKAADAHQYIRPHVDRFNTKFQPLMRQKIQDLTGAVSPHFETVKQHVASSREYIAPHVDTVHKTVNPYVQAVKTKSQPYIDQAKTCAAPHVERVQTFARPHYNRAANVVNGYHSQVQSHLKQILGTYKFATEKFIWVVAAAILALPLATLFMFIRSALGSPRKPVNPKRHRSSHSGSSSTSKKPRRSRQADKNFEN